MIVGKIENGIERGFVKHRLNCLLITDPLYHHALIKQSRSYLILRVIISSTITTLADLCLNVSDHWPENVNNDVSKDSPIVSLLDSFYFIVIYRYYYFLKTSVAAVPRLTLMSFLNLARSDLISHVCGL